MSGGLFFGLAVLTTLVMSGVVLEVGGTGEEGLRTWVRATTRLSFLFFLAAYVASPARRLWPVAFTGWLLRIRRQVGLSFAFAHVVHGVSILALSVLLGDAFRADPLTLVFGGAAYVLIAAMTLTSSNRAQRWLGRDRWRVLHRTGMHWIYFVFLVSWLPDVGHGPIYLLNSALVLVAGGIRLAAWRRTTARMAPMAAS